MEIEAATIGETGLAALIFAATFLVGGRLHPLRSLIRDRRTIVSFGAGVSVAYVFIHVLPELQRIRGVFAANVSEPLPYEGMGIYVLALVGFMAFYGLDHLRSHLREADSRSREFKLHVGGFAIYVALISYLLVRSLEETPVSITTYAVAVTLHLWAVDHELRRDHGASYERAGRLILAGMPLAGWTLGLLVEVPILVVAMLLAFVSGAVIMNSMIMELPSEKAGRFLPFVSGGIVYALILVPLS